MKSPPPPKNLRLGHYDIEVTTRKETSQHNWGTFDQQNYTISVEAEWPNPGKCLEVILHELLHACWYAANLKDNDKEERIVGSLAVWLAMVLRDNPNFVKWITHVSKQK